MPTELITGLVVGGLTLAGALLGGLLSTWSDRRREHRAALDRHRDLCARIPALFESLRSRTWSVVDYRADTSDWRHDAWHQHQLERVEDIYAEFHAVYFALRLLGPESVVEAAFPLWDAANQLISWAYGPKKPRHGDLQLDELIARRDRFLAAVPAYLARPSD